VENLRLGEVADLVGGRCVGDPEHEVTGIAPVDESEPGHIAYLAAERYVQYAAECSAGAFLVSEELLHAVPSGVHAVVVADPYPALQRLLVHLHPDEREPAKIHPTAVIEEGVVLGTGVTIGPYAVLERGVTVGNGTRIGAHAVLGAGTTVGSNSNLHPHVVTYHDTVIGDDVQIQSGARLGADGFGYTLIDGEHRKIPHVGRLVIGDGVEIGANTAIDRGSLGNTRIGQGVKIDNLVHIAHNCVIGPGTMAAAQVGIAGSTTIGAGAILAGQYGVAGHLRIGSGVRVGAKSAVLSDVEAGRTVLGIPAADAARMKRAFACIARLPEMRQELRALAERLESLLSEDPGPARD